MTTMTTAGPTPALLQDINAAFNSRDVDRIMEFFAEDCTFLMARGPEAVLRAALAPLADGLGADTEAPGEVAGALAGAGDLGPDGWRGTGIGMDLQHGSSPSRGRGMEALEAVGVV